MRKEALMGKRIRGGEAEEYKEPQRIYKTETQLHRIKEINAFRFKCYKTITHKNNSVQFSAH